MTAWLGTAGSMLRLLSGPRLSRAGGLPSQDRKTYGSGRGEVTTGPARFRTWSVNRGATYPNDRLTLEYVAAGAFPGAVTYYSDEATAGNVLHPEHSTLLDWQRPGACLPGWTRTGAITTTGGLIVPVMAVASVSTVVVGTGYPVPAGVTVTAGAHAGGSGITVRVRWRNAAGTQLSESVSPASTAAGQRVTVTATAPATAVTFDLVVVGVSAASVGALSVSFTSQAMPFQIGSGCLSAILTERSVDVITAWSKNANPASAISGVQYTLEEVRA